MANTRWYIQNRKASSADIAFALHEKRAEKKKRAKVLREQMQARLKADADHRALGVALRRAVREQERQYRKTIRAIVEPRSHREVTKRDRQFEAMLALTFTRASVKRGDGFSSFHFKVRSRGFGERRQNRAHVFRSGETVNCLRYIIRADAREISGGGIVSNISDNPEILAGFYQSLEDFERNDRANAMVYMSAVISLPHELTSSEREQVLREICAILGHHDLPHVGVLHAPDAQGDQRNFHAHLLFSMRPVETLGMNVFAFSAEKHSDLNDDSFITEMRGQIAHIFNRVMERAGHARRFTPLSNAQRGLSAMSKSDGKSSPGKKAIERKERDLALMKAEQGFNDRVQPVLYKLLELSKQVAAWPVRDFAAEARQRIAQHRSAGKTPVRAVASIAKGPRPAGQGAPSRNATLVPDYRHDPARVRTIADLVKRLDGHRHLPLIKTPATDGQSHPHYRLEPVDRFDRRGPLFAAVAPFEDDDQVQSAFDRSRQRSLYAAEAEITTLRREPFDPGQKLTLKDFGAQDEHLQRAVFLMREDADFADMLTRARKYWIERRARERRDAEMAASAAIPTSAPEGLDPDDQGLRPQPLQLPESGRRGPDR